MVKPPTFDSNGMKKGAWSKEEDEILRAFVLEFGHHNWRRLPLLAGLARCGKSCRLRWMNYLKPGLKRGKITKHEEDLIIKLHHQLGTKWSAIAAKLPGRTDNEVKNYWHAHIKKRGRRGHGGAIKLENESSSSEISSCHLQEENVDVHSVARDGDHVLTELAYDQTYLPQFDADFGLFQEMQTPTFASSSDSGTSNGDCFWSEPFGDDILDMVLW